jgi:hypothetical protein
MERPKCRKSREMDGGAIRVPVPARFTGGETRDAHAATAVIAGA